MTAQPEHSERVARRCFCGRAVSNRATRSAYRRKDGTHGALPDELGPHMLLCPGHYAEWNRDFSAPRQRREERADAASNALARCWRAIEDGFALIPSAVAVVPHRPGAVTLRLPCHRVAVDVMMETEPSGLSAWFTNRMKVRRGAL